MFEVMNNDYRVVDILKQSSATTIECLRPLLDQERNIERLSVDRHSRTNNTLRLRCFYLLVGRAPSWFLRC